MLSETISWLLNLEPRAALRAVVHELGEEIFATRSPNVLKAWLHYPHSVMESSRYHPARNSQPPCTAWFRALNLIREPRKDLEDIRPLVLESLRRRLLTYGQDVAAAIRNRQGVRRRRRWTFEREAEWYVRTVGKLLSVVAETERTSKNPAAVDWIAGGRDDERRECGNQPKRGRLDLPEPGPLDLAFQDAELLAECQNLDLECGFGLPAEDE